MISWIQTTFQKHTKFFIFFLLVAITIPFVFTIGAAPGIGRAEHKVLEQDFFGYNLGNQEQANRIMRDGNFSAQLRGAYQTSVQEYALTRIAGLALADQLGLPVPSEKEVSAYIANLPVFRDQQGNFDQQRYQQLADSLKGNREFSVADASRVMREDARLEALSKVIAGPGYVLPSDVAQQLKNADSTWSLAVASLDYAKFDPNLTVTDEALSRYFEDNSFRYEIPARPRLSVIEFRNADFAPANAPTEAEMRAVYNANPARFPAPADAEKKDATPSLSLDQGADATDNFPKVRAQVEAAMKEQAARNRASRTANDFTVALFERKAAANSPELQQFLSAQNVRATELPPFTPDAPPADRNWLANYTQQIDRLGADRYFSDPLPTPTGYAVLLWHETLPAHKPLLAEVREKVAADYRESEKRKRFTEHARSVREKLTAAVKSGQSFADAAAAQQLEVQSFTNFSLRQPPQDLPYAAYSAMQSLQPGQISEMVFAGDKGQFVFAAERKLPDTSSANPRYAELRQQLMQYTAAANEGALLSGLVEQELRRTAPRDADR